MRKLILIAALLGIGACAHNSQPVRLGVQHPIAEDLVCPAEPPALTDEQIAADPEGRLEDRFNTDVLLAGRACRDALARACRWHVERGLALPAGWACGAPRPRVSAKAESSGASGARRG